MIYLIFIKDFTKNNICYPILSTVNNLIVNLVADYYCTNPKPFDLDFTNYSQITNLIIKGCKDKVLSLPNNLTLLTNVDISGCTYETINFNDLPNIQKLNCFGNKFNQLENLPNSLVELNCAQNPIRTINNIPENLTSITVDKKFNSNTPVFNSRTSTLSIYEKGDENDEEDDEEDDEENDEENDEEDIVGN